MKQTREERYAWEKMYTAKKKALGICATCLSKVAPTSKLRCQKHLNYHKARAKKRYHEMQDCWNMFKDEYRKRK